MRNTVLVILMALGSAGAFAQLPGPHGSSGREIVPSTPNPLTALLEALSDYYREAAKARPADQGLRARQSLIEGLRGQIAKANHLPSEAQTLLAVLLGSLEPSAQKSALILDALKDAASPGVDKGAAATASALLASPLVKRFEDSQKKMPAPKAAVDKRGDQEVTWVVDHLAEETGEGDYSVSKTRGLVRAPLGLDNKEKLPPFRLALRFDAARKGYVLYYTKADGGLVPVGADGTQAIELQVIPGVFFHEGRQALYSFRSSDSTRIDRGFLVHSEPRLEFTRLQLQDLGTEEIVKFYDGKSTEKVSPFLDTARLLAEAQRKARVPLNPPHEPLDIGSIEVELGLGSAVTPPRPLSFAALDAGAREFLVIDEKDGVAYLQQRDPGGVLRLKRLELLEPRRFGYPPGDTSGSHVIMSRRSGQATGLDEGVPAEDRIERGWIVQDEQGRILSLRELRRSPGYRVGSLFDLSRGPGGAR